ncbi:MAG: hypothetical protein LBF06_06780, partial [Pseudomonas sp.]|nr:hypothetical protein [Pseudomonas sp.]
GCSDLSRIESGEQPSAVFQAIENAGQYTQPPSATKARQAGGKGTFMLPGCLRRSGDRTIIRPWWRICPKMRVFIIFEQP